MQRPGVQVCGLVDVLPDGNLRAKPLKEAVEVMSLKNFPEDNVEKPPSFERDHDVRWDERESSAQQQVWSLNLDRPLIASEHNFAMSCRASLLIC